MKLKLDPYLLDTIPQEIIAAATLVDRWMKQNGYERWALMGICSRNHAEDLESLQEAVKSACKEMSEKLNRLKD